ncbi:POTRA domain-containing protein, partial [Ancylobacter mangrovi]|uniref:POTRA domain-containing protein n=1 Tax=Ancylobacter mangrovi TaxID=2972472 RepID=UPI002162EBA1
MNGSWFGKTISFLAIVLLFVVGNVAVSWSATGGVAGGAAASVVVEGNQRVDADTIRSYFATDPGQSLTPAKIDEALKSLYATGL